MRKIGKFSIIILISLVILGGFVLLALNFKTGFFHPEKIDETDSKTWNYSDGIIVGSEELRYYAQNDTCWLMVHGYASTPKDLRPLAEEVIGRFNDTVVLPRLQGHGELPSSTMNLSFKDWYSQVDSEFQQLKASCEKVNLVGFSFGSALSLRIAEENSVNNIYLLSPFLRIRYKAYHIFSKEKYISLIAEGAKYSVKFTPAQINNPEGGKEYIGYLSFPLVPIKNSFEDIRKVEEDLKKVNASHILTFHSENDDTIDVESSRIINRTVGVKNELVIYEKSNHVLLVDYDKDDVLQRVIKFEEKSR